MKKLKLGLVLLAFLTMTGASFASGIGYIDYYRVMDNYDYAQKAIKEVSAKELELQQFIIDKQKEFKALDTPLKRQTFEQKTAQELKTKEQALVALRTKRETEVMSKVKEAAKAVMVEQKLDAVMTQGGIFVGGVDITDLIITKLKGAR